jgi:predicted transcriptional regulator
MTPTKAADLADGETLPSSQAAPTAKKGSRRQGVGIGTQIIYHGLTNAQTVPATPPPPPSAPPPITLPTPFEIQRSVTPDYIVSFEDGRRRPTLKRHLITLGLTPDQYRSKWGLPDNYPMVAPCHSARREFARAAGLGRSVGKRQPASARRPK